MRFLYLCSLICVIIIMWKVGLLCIRYDGAAGCCSDRLLSLFFGKPPPLFNPKEGGNSVRRLGLRRDNYEELA